MCGGEGTVTNSTGFSSVLCVRGGVCFSPFVDAKTFFCLRLCMYTVWVGVRARG